MANNYKPVEYASSTFESKKYHKKQVFSNTSEGISAIHFRSESLTLNDTPGVYSYSTSGSHYAFLKHLLFDSASYVGYDGIFTNKFPTSGSVIYIPQQYYGEEIKPNSFRLNDNSSDSTIVIRDDGLGNLYSTNAINSRSAASSISSSENYVGNIQYQMGIVTINETGSWSGSGDSDTDIMYTDIGSGEFKVRFNATQTIHQNHIVCKIDKREFTATSNTTLWDSNHNLIENISSSIQDWSPYATGIAFYDSQPDIFGRFQITEHTFQINYGFNVIKWPNNSIVLNNDIPGGIVEITGDGQSAIKEKNDNDESYWSGTLERLNPGTTYTFRSEQSSTFTWKLKSEQINRGVPLLVGQFPKAVKIDKESDLTIIIRYDI